MPEMISLASKIRYSFFAYSYIFWASLVAQTLKNLPVMPETIKVLFTISRIVDQLK